MNRFRQLEYTDLNLQPFRLKSEMFDHSVYHCRGVSCIEESRSKLFIKPDKWTTQRTQTLKPVLPAMADSVIKLLDYYNIKQQAYLASQYADAKF